MCIAQSHQAYLLTIFYINMFTTIHSYIRELMDDLEYENEGEFDCKWCQKRSPSDAQMSCIYSASYAPSYERKQPLIKSYNHIHKTFGLNQCNDSWFISKW